MSEFAWTEENLSAFRDMWENRGLTARQIAAQLGVSRSAICAKARRMNLSQRASMASHAPRPRAPREPRAPNPKAPRPGNVVTLPVIARRPVPPPEPVRPLAEPVPLDLDGGRVTILHLSDKTCKWPIGDPGADDFCFCGHKPRDGSPYCAYHAQLAFQPLPDRRHRSAPR